MEMYAYHVYMHIYVYIILYKMGYTSITAFYVTENKELMPDTPTSMRKILIYIWMYDCVSKL